MANEQPDQQPASFWHELMRRRVFRVGASYAVVGWVIIQVAETMADIYDFPAWGVQLFTTVVILGFPVAVLLGWSLQVTPQGIRFDKPKDSTELAVGAALLIASTALGVWLWTLRPALTDSAAGVPHSIAVLPFSNIGDDVQDDYLCDGVAEEIRSRLLESRHLAVAARTSSMSFRNTNADIPTIAQRLGVSYVLEGSVRRSNKNIRISAQLVDPRSNLQVWSNTYNREFSDLFAIQDDIAQAVVNALKIVLDPAAKARIERRSTGNVAAFDDYLRAVSMSEKSNQPADLDAAIELFQAALSLDSEFALPHAGLCDVFVRKYRVQSEPESIRQARAACDSGLKLDPFSSEAHIARGNLLIVTGQLDDAVAAFQRAIELNPTAISAYFGLASAYDRQNRPEEAEQTYKFVIGVRPANWDAYTALGNFYFRLGRFSEAAEKYRSITLQNPDNATAYNNIGAALMMAGDFAGAAEAFDKSVSLSPASNGYTNLGTMHYYLGNFEDAIATYQKALMFTGRDYRLWGNMADAYRFIGGQTDLSLAAYRQAIELAEEALAVNPSDPVTLATLGYYYAGIGSHAKAAEKLAEAKKQGAGNIYVHYFGSLVHLLQEQTGRAMDDLEQAVALGYPKVLITSAPEFAGLASNPRFQRLFSGKGT